MEIIIFISWVKVFQRRRVGRFGFFTFTRFTGWWIFFTHVTDENHVVFFDLLKILLLLSHGQASVERGFSVNKETEVENLLEHSLVVQTTCRSDDYLCDERLKNHCSAMIFNWYKVWQKTFILDEANDSCSCVGDEPSRHNKYIDVKDVVVGFRSCSLSAPSIVCVFVHAEFTGIGQIDCLWFKHVRSNSFQSR